MKPGKHSPVEESAFLEKFKAKRTSDDCLTPPNVYEAVRGWVFRRYGLAPETPVVRPFWPGGDYEAADYPAGCVVLDNPPFSIVSRIVAFYQGRGVRFFLFAPYLTNLGIGRGTGCGHVVAPWTVRYENGAEVPTSFVTNLDPETVAESAPDLLGAVRAADEANRAAKVRTLPKYSYPPEVVTSAALGYIAEHGVPFRVRRGECAFLRKLDAMGGRGIFGGGLLLSPRAAAERAAAERAAERAAGRAAAERWTLSERERLLSETLSTPTHLESTRK